MSAAEAADPGPIDQPGGVVIPMTRNPKPKRVRRDRLDGATEPEAGQELAVHMEAFFRQHDRTLTDEDTAAVYVMTLELVETMLASFAARGALEDVQHDELARMIDEMRNAPERL